MKLGYFWKQNKIIVTFVIMIDRIKLLMSVKNISPAQLANSIGVQRSGISHILSGRNKPSLDFVLKIFDSFPDLNETWLLKGEGEMLKTTRLQESVTDISGNDNPSMHILTMDQPKEGLQDKVDESRNALDKKNKEVVQEINYKDLEMKKEDSIPEVQTQRKIIKWVAIYDDDSFKEFHGQ